MEDKIEDLDDIDELVKEFKKHPAFMTEFDPTQPMSPEMEALQALKYESGSATERATGYKEDGNENFRLKKYQWAIDSYTEGIKCKSKNKELNAILYTNRAASHFRIENYRTSLRDCLRARVFKRSHLKAIVRGAWCCFRLKKFRQCELWCQDALTIDPNNTEILQLRSQIADAEKIHETELLETKAKLLLETQNKTELLNAIKIRKIQLDSDSIEASVDTMPIGSPVYLNDESLFWPVLLLYPEHKVTDVINEFPEDETFIDHLAEVLAEPPPWDSAGIYRTEFAQVYFEDFQSSDVLIQVPLDFSLLKAISNPRFDDFCR